MIENFVERAEWKNQHQTKPSDEVEDLILLNHAALRNFHTERIGWLFLDQAQRVTVGVPDHHCFFEPELGLRLRRDGHQARADERRTSLTQSADERLDIPAHQRRLPMPEIVGLGLGGHHPSAGRRLVLEEFDVRRRRGRHHRRHDAGVIEQAVQHVLRRSAVQGGAAHAEAEHIPVERHALLGAGHGHCGVVDAAKELVAGLLPRWVTFARREIDQLERMTLGVMKLDRLDAGRPGIGWRDGDRREEMCRTLLSCRIL